MRLPGEDALRRERVRFMETIESLTDEEFEHGPTLCEDWAPRDVLAHIIGTDYLPRYYLRPSVFTGSGIPPLPDRGAGDESPSTERAQDRRPKVRKHPLQRLLRVSDVIAYRGNGIMVRRANGLSRAELTERGWHCAEHLTRITRSWAALLLGDNAMHHQDVLRGLGRRRDVPDEVAPAMFREGRIWSWAYGGKLLRYRLQPTTPGGFACGRGIPVEGTTEALALWLAGRRGIEPELKFG